jgi:outer membrane protein assembly factor BamB
MKHLMFRSLCLGITFAFALVSAFGRGSAEAADVLTQQYNNTRTGANLNETQLTAANVASGRFAKLWTLYTDGQVTAQPLYVSNLAIDTSDSPNTPAVRGTFNAVVIATMHNTVYAYDAEKENSGPDGRTVPLWATWLGQPRPGGKEIDMFSTNDPEWGILSTPVVSDNRKTLYVAAWHDEGQAGLVYRLHALELRNGKHRQPSVAIGPSSSDPSNPCNTRGTVNPCKHKQRAALLLNDGIIYVGFGGDGNRGALFAFDAQTLAQKAFWHPTPSGNDGGIWQSGQGPAADGQGNIYLMTGNGTFDADRNGKNFGSSFVKLRLEGQGLEVKDYFTPCNFQFLNDLDLDLGSAGPVLLPGTRERIVSGGKEGVLYLLSSTDMGKFASSGSGNGCQNPKAMQEFRVAEAQVHNGQTHWGNIHGSPVFWDGPDTGRVYVWAENNPLKAYRFRGGKLQDVANPQRSAFVPPLGMPGGMIALSADGKKAQTGIVWAVVPLDGDANRQRGVKGIVLALDAQDVTRTLWTSEQVAQRDRLGLFAKFTPPLVADGKVFVATYGDNEQRRTYNPPNDRPTTFPRNYHVTVYGVQPAPAVPRVVVNQDRDDVTVVGASTAPLQLDLTRCKTADAGSVDCAEELASRFNRPAFHRVLFSAGQSISGCAVVRVTTAGKDAGLTTATGIGFYSAQAAAGNRANDDVGLFVPKGRLKSVRTATLLNGEKATLHEFVGVANCDAGGSGALSRLFKPYMEFPSANDGRIFRNWDLAEKYRVGGDVTQFDRSGDVLRP